MVVTDLTGEWRLRSLDGSFRLKAQVPGTILTSLFEGHLIDDPFYRDNEVIAHEISYKDFLYLRTFYLTKDAIKQKCVELVFEGIDTLATVLINGKTVLNANNMHRSWRVDIKDAVYAGENTIEVYIHSPSRYVDKRQDEGKINLYIDSIKSGCQYIRKGHYMFGWDWGPQMPDGGIYRPVYIECYSHPRIDDVRFIQRHENGNVEVKALVSISNHLAGCQICFQLIDEDGNVLSDYIAAPTNQQTLSVTVENPKLWWANGYGKQQLYIAKISLICDGKIIDEKNLRIGLRTLEISREADSYGEEFCFKLNGIKIFAMGSNYIPQDSLISRVNKESTRRLLQDCIRANHNSIRIWGGGYYPEDYFYDICDELGLIVWHDFMFACNIYEFDKEFIDNVTAEVTEQIRRLRHHACLGMWCGNNEMELIWTEWGGIEASSPSHLEQYAQFFEDILPNIIVKEDPGRFYWPSSPSSGGVRKGNSQDENRGDVHYWQVWHGLKPFTDYRNRYFRFLSEFGFQSFPSRKTIEMFTEPGDLNIFSYVLEKHQKNKSANGKILYYLSENYLYPKDLDSLIYASQIMQAEAMRYCVEHMRRNRGKCMGSYYWQLNDCWTVASWSSIDYYGRWKALHYYSQRFYAPVLLSCEESGYKVKLHVANETRNPFKGIVKWSVRNNYSAIIAEAEIPVSLDALSGEYVIELDLQEYFSEGKNRYERYFTYSLETSGGKVSENSTLFCPAKHFKFINPQIRAVVTEKYDCFVLTLNSSAFAQGVELDLKTMDTIFSENWFDLQTGQSKTITLKKCELPEGLTVDMLQDQLIIRSVYNIAN